jgi:hypothetical protein
MAAKNARRDDPEAAIIVWSAIGSNEIGDQRSPIAPKYRDLLVQIGIELRASLLHENPREILRRFEAVAGEITGHNYLSSAGKYDSYIGPGWNVLGQPLTQIGHTLRFEEIVKHADLGPILGAACDFLRASVGKAAIGRLAIARGDELGRDAQPFCLAQRVPLRS